MYIDRLYYGRHTLTALVIARVVKSAEIVKIPIDHAALADILREWRERFAKQRKKPMNCRMCGQAIDETAVETLEEYETFDGYCWSCERLDREPNDNILASRELEDFEGLEPEWDYFDDDDFSF